VRAVPAVERTLIRGEKHARQVRAARSLGECAGFGETVLNGNGRHCGHSEEEEEEEEEDDEEEDDEVENW